MSFGENLKGDISATNFDLDHHNAHQEQTRNFDSIRFINSLANTANYYSKSQERNIQEEYERVKERLKQKQNEIGNLMQNMSRANLDAKEKEDES